MTFSQTFCSRQFIWEIVRILTVGIASHLFYFHLIPLPILLAAMAFGLYSLVKVAAPDLIKGTKKRLGHFSISAFLRQPYNIAM